MKLRVLIEQDEDGIYIAECPGLPGCISQGETRKEALKNIKDAIDGYLKSLKKHDEPVPPPITEEIVEILSAPSVRTCRGSIYRTRGLDKSSPYNFEIPYNKK